MFLVKQFFCFHVKALICYTFPMWWSSHKENLLSDTRTEKRKLGDIGENAVSEYLKNKGFSILERNYSRKWGELDIVAKKGGKIHFVEVKSISREISLQKTPLVSCETENKISREKNQSIADQYRAEDNLHPWKLKRLSRIIQRYLLDKNIPDHIEWQFDVATVLVDQNKRICQVTILKDIIL